MRWSQQAIELDEQQRLPGYRDAVIRHFDAPEAVDTRFYEVRARSVLNRVPEASRMPFRWTVNPYRGCTHACSYCLIGDTEVLGADGRYRPIRDLGIGDEIVGTELQGPHRRYVRTVVRDKWSSIQPAHSVMLSDGTEIVASGEHRFLTSHGWKHVTGADQGRDRRPHLTESSEMLGPGGYIPAPQHDGDYRRGYRSGLVRGEANLRSDRVGVLAAAGARSGVPATCEESGSAMQRIRELIEWPVLPSQSWIKGFLAGVSDAEGDDNQEMRALTGRAVEECGKLRVVSVRRLGMVARMYDITTETGDFVANGVISHNCFARPTHEYLGFDAGRDFEREIVVKVNAPERLRAELARPAWSGEHVALGTNTDPYQWVEGRYELLPGIWSALRDARNPFSVLTKSPLLLRDLALLRELNAVTDFSAALSVPTVDARAWRASEPRSPNPRARLEAVAELTRSGIRTGVLVAPLMPGINDAPEQIEEVLRLAGEAGAAYVSGIALHLRKGVREVFMAWLADHRPDLVPRYEELYRRSAYAPPAERMRLARLLDGFQPDAGGRIRRGLRDRPARATEVPAGRFERGVRPPAEGRAQTEEAPRLF